MYDSGDKTASPKPAYHTEQILMILTSSSPSLLPPPGSIELRLSDMVRAAKSSNKCTIEMAKDRAGPRFSIFRAKKMKGWWPLTRLKTAEDFEREEKEREEAKKKGKKKKKKDKRSKMRPEDIQYTDSSGNTFLLMVQKRTPIYNLSFRHLFLQK